MQFQLKLFTTNANGELADLVHAFGVQTHPNDVIVTHGVPLAVASAINATIESQQQVEPVPFAVQMRRINSDGSEGCILWHQCWSPGANQTILTQGMPGAITGAVKATLASQ